MIKAIVFDFDGLILDTETQSFRSMQKMYEKYHVELPFELWSKCIGARGGFDAVKYLEEQTGQSIDAAAFYQEREKIFIDLIEEEDILPGVESILETAQKLGIRIGLATSSHEGWAAGHLQRLGILDYFEYICTGDDVKNAKPDPEIYLKVLEYFGVKPEEAIAFEDSLNGALAAKRAGMFCVVVPNYVTQNMAFEDIDEKLESLADTSLEKLIEAFSG
ncbi:HAD superfamily hydrolase (TIGR01509 family) [Scopulibacillus daqui]|uniref:HAD superfamily hydrolase (TIGR01509 family) n=1 Tax=Scopulibacillus daqui TaxID=1469162 RepID=A0ABS2Q3G9_9BACL|nr:HAD family phosphatase [Scopulibacillus daqui]MBM7646846.1 HAD superfamily hydrolase (TIGR01509 family) [Scopulibacillus daqui]